MKHSQLAGLVPRLELFDIPKGTRREDVVATNHIGCHVTGGWGEPATTAEEPFLSRWGSGGQLVVAMDDDDNGPRAVQGGSFGLRRAVDGMASMGVTASRVVATFRKASSIVGGIDERKLHKVLVLSWPYEDLATVELTWKSKLMGGRKVIGMTLGCIDVPAQLQLMAAYPLSASWEGGLGTKDDMPGFAQQVVAAAGAFRLAQQPEAGEAERLRRVIAGERTTEGAEEVAWLTDPDA
jgi:hypothetical protein